MTGKSRRRVGKNSSQSKKKRGGLTRQAVPVQPSAAAQVSEPVTSPDSPVPEASVPTHKAEPLSIRYPYISAELRTIGILAGIMLLILVVLALFFS